MTNRRHSIIIISIITVYVGHTYHVDTAGKHRLTVGSCYIFSRVNALLYQPRNCYLMDEISSGDDIMFNSCFDEAPILHLFCFST